MARNNKHYLGKLAKEYCKKFQTSATREIARVLITDHPEAFRDMEHARSVVQVLIGEGLWSRTKKNPKEYPGIPRVVIPKADKQSDFTPYKITEFPVAVSGYAHAIP